MKIFLVRHGDKQNEESTVFTVKMAVVLNRLGIKQIETLAKYLKNNYPELNKLEYIFSSPIQRAVQTAEILRSELKIKEIKISPILAELYPVNDYSVPKDIRDEMFRKALNNIDLVNENKTVFRKLILDFLKFLKENYQEDRPMLVSTHGALIRSTIYFLFPKYKPTLDKILESKIHNGGVTILDYDGQNFTLNKFDFADHLVNVNESTE